MTKLIERSSKMATKKRSRLARKTEDVCQARAAAAEATRKAEAQRLAPETAQKTKGERLKNYRFPKKCLIPEGKPQTVQRVASQRLPLESACSG